MSPSRPTSRAEDRLGALLRHRQAIRLANAPHPQGLHELALLLQVISSFPLPAFPSSLLTSFPLGFTRTIHSRCQPSPTAAYLLARFREVAKSRNIRKEIPVKTTMRILIVSLLASCPLALPVASADTLVFPTGRTVRGTVLQTNGEEVLMWTGYSAYNFSLANVKTIKFERAEAAEVNSTNRLPSTTDLILLLSKQPWASHLRQIPATVIDKGMLRNVPYVSFRCGDDYEINVYGDLDRPAAIEAGVYRKLLDDTTAKKNCVGFMNALLGQAADKQAMQGLAPEKDLKTRDGMTFEITPPFAEDAYMGWWVSVYSEQQLNLARASAEELQHISVPRAEASKSRDSSGWSAEEVKLARPSVPPTITCTTKSGLVLSNAIVVRVMDGVSLVWREGASGGVLMLAELPEDLRARFGYDPAMSAAADTAEELRKAREWQQAQMAAAHYANETQDSGLHATANTAGTGYAPSSSGGSSSYARGHSSSGGGSVYVHGYTKSNGTYVSGYTRSAPHSRR